MWLGRWGILRLESVMGTGMGKPKPSARGFSAAKQQVNKSSADHAAKEQLAGALINQSRFEEAEAIYRSLIAAGTTNHIVYILSLIHI